MNLAELGFFASETRTSALSAHRVFERRISLQALPLPQHSMAGVCTAALLPTW